MGYTESNIKEYSSLISYGKGYEIHQEIPLNLSLGFRNGSDFFNSLATKWNENRNYLRCTSLIDELTDKEYIRFLNKIELDYNFINNPNVNLYFVQKKFSEIYNKFSYFKFESISVEYTYDNSLLFSVNNNESKYLIEYYLDYNIDLDDDVEIIFTKLNSKENKFYEMLLENIHDFLKKEFQKETSKVLLDY